MSQQLELSFNIGRPLLTAEEKHAALNQIYANFFGNEKAVAKLKRIDYDALGHYNHANPALNLNIALIGSPSTGKTQIAHLHNQARQLPFVKISPRGVKTVHELFEEIRRVAQQAGVPLIGDKNYILPPMDIFIDEVHACNAMLIQGLLKATEHDEHKMVTEKGYVVDCLNIHWIIATTERGKLFDAFDTRFIKITLGLYDKETLAKIVHSKHTDWSMEVCRLVAYYCSKVPREALAFSREMQLEYNMHPAPWIDIAKKIATDNDIDEYGMTYKRFLILKALGQGPIAEKRLPTIAGVKREELDKFIMPWLLEFSDDQKAFVAVNHRGYNITKAGAQELAKRCILYKKEAIMENAA